MAFPDDLEVLAAARTGTDLTEVRDFLSHVGGDSWRGRITDLGMDSQGKTLTFRVDGRKRKIQGTGQEKTFLWALEGLVPLFDLAVSSLEREEVRRQPVQTELFERI